MKITKTKLDGVYKIQLDPFVDFRGEYVETYNHQLYTMQIPGVEYRDVDKIHFVQDDISISRKNVLRGIHGDDRTWKLVSCIHGEMYFVVINCDKRSKDFGDNESFILSDRDRFQLLLPPKYGNAMLTLSDKSIFQYKQTSYYQGKENQFTYKYDEVYFGIDWPIHRNNIILSERDRGAEYIPDEELIERRK